MKSAFGRLLCTSVLSLLALFPARAEKDRISREQAEGLVSGLKYQQGEITLQNGLATLHVPDGFQFPNGSNEADGYVSDKDAEKINYAELLTQMQKDVDSGNEERQKAGYEPIQLVGWSKAPRYDSNTHKLYWAVRLWDMCAQSKSNSALMLMFM